MKKALQSIKLSEIQIDCLRCNSLTSILYLRRTLLMTKVAIQPLLPLSSNVNRVLKAYLVIQWYYLG